MKLTTKATICAVIAITVWWGITYGTAIYVGNQIQDTMMIGLERIFENLDQILRH